MGGGNYYEENAYKRLKKKWKIVEFLEASSTTAEQSDTNKSEDSSESTEKKRAITVKHLKNILKLSSE